jgi:hypothetical protein
LLEGFQAGLSWITVLRKREHYRKVMFGFDPKRLAVLSDAEIEQLMLDPGIVRNRLKLNATRRNARPGWRWRIRWVALVVCRRRAQDQSFQGSQPGPGDYARGRSHEQSPQKSRFYVRRPDYLLRVHAGLRHGHGPHPWTATCYADLVNAG